MGFTGSWREYWADLLPPHADSGDASYGLKGAPGWRLGFTDPPPPAMALKLPRHHVYGGLVDRWGLWPQWRCSPGSRR